MCLYFLKVSISFVSSALLICLILILSVTTILLRLHFNIHIALVVGIFHLSRTELFLDRDLRHLDILRLVGRDGNNHSLCHQLKREEAETFIRLRALFGLLQVNFNDNAVDARRTLNDKFADLFSESVLFGLFFF